MENVRWIGAALWRPNNIVDRVEFTGMIYWHSLFLHAIMFVVMAAQVFYTESAHQLLAQGSLQTMIIEWLLTVIYACIIASALVAVRSFELLTLLNNDRTILRSFVWWIRIVVALQIIGALCVAGIARQVYYPDLVLFCASFIAPVPCYLGVLMNISTVALFVKKSE